MPEVEQQVAVPEDNTAQLSEALEQEVTQESSQVAADTTETEAETDEQKNERELKAQQERADKRARGVQKRLDELTADKYAERSAREAAERRLDMLMAQQQPRPAIQQDQTEPQRGQFDDYEKFIEARAEWRAEKAVERRMSQQTQQWDQQRQQGEVQRQAQAIASDFQRKLAEGRKSIPDFDEVIADASDVQVGNAFPAIATSDNPAALMVYLGKNPDVAARLSTLPPVLAAREIGKLEAKLVTPPQVSKAPSPGKPVGSKPGSASDPPEDIEGYMAWAKKNMR